MSRRSERNVRRIVRIEGTSSRDDFRNIINRFVISLRLKEKLGIGTEEEVGPCDCVSCLREVKERVG